jgi:hypothetical protein
MPKDKATITGYVDAEVAAYLDRIAAAEFRSRSSTLALLIVKEATARGYHHRAPETISPPVLVKKA